MKWPEVPIDSFCRPKQWPTISQSQLTPTGYPVYGANGQIGWYSTYNHESETVLITCRGATCGTVNVSPPKSYVTGNAMALDSLDEARIHLRYLVHVLTPERLRRSITGSAQPQITRESLKAITVPLPPLADQRRIAAILDQADRLRSHRHGLLRRYSELKRAGFASMFAGISSSGKLGDYGEVQGGLQVSRKRESLPLERPYLRVANIYRGKLDLGEVKTIRVTEAESMRVRLEPGDLLFVEGHANPNEVGRVAEWNGSVPDCLHQNHLIRVRLDRSAVEPTYAEAWFNSRDGSMHFQRAGKTTSGLNTINASQLRAAPLPVPPISLQREYVTVANAIDNHLRDQTMQSELVDELFVSLQSRAFSGQL
ncbi:restriction endonuclease subunit S [Mycolicibacterium sp. PAM1]|uniref:Restriction modification system DNA specificity domain n=1 Tax=Mycolicibacterium gilvum (strain PYR-GCK) TaxID=350054 RepID=A4T4W1_MYCGI|nr:restriction endonuclease subunit S [Mycolicibacterium sp. PAM1]ABP43288.1 restriction modification system DNA specificity domain [Mycolicibacterium gilvum PYR-GCK]MBV5246457.1 restriction endonuclease subunit S [Mycolicibacterium sp. PAM1]